MRRGYAGLLVAILAVTTFINPMSVPHRVASPPQKTASSTFPTPGRLITGPSTDRNHNKAGDALTPGYCQEKTKECQASGMLAAIQDFFGQNEGADIPHWNVPAVGRKRLRFIITIVPDPTHTRLPLVFDRQIDSIQEAVQADNYLFARAYMPWESKSFPESTDFRITIARQTYQDAKESYPGIMMFRKVLPSPAFDKTISGLPRTLREREQRQSLFVFVVGETPTGGINKDQFENAVHAMEEICSLKGENECIDYPPRRNLFILGPTFSGSLYSLKGLLETHELAPFLAVTVQSGSASDLDTIEWFEKFTPQQPKVVFRSFQESSKYALANLLRFTEGQGYAAKDVAVLSEDETAYGKVPNQDSQDSCQQAPTNPIGSNGIARCEAKAETTKAPPDDTSKVLRLYFPRNISQLRDAYQQDESARQSAEANAGNPPRTTLQTSLDDNGSDDDTIAAYSRIQTPLSQEAIMLGIAASLQRHNIRFVLLQATNPIDMLFLTRFLHATNSQARIVTIDTDLLLTRQDDDPRLRGTMQISSYPLIPGIDDQVATPQVSPPVDRIDRVFPTNYSAGTFNAMLSLMTAQDLQPCAIPSAPPTMNYNPNKLPIAPGESESKLNPAPCTEEQRKSDCADLIPKGYAQYGWPSAAGTPPSQTADGARLNILAPPLWLTVLGREGYWPVALLDSEVESSRPEQWLPVIPREIHTIIGQGIIYPFQISAPPSWILLCTLFLILMIAFVFSLSHGSVMSPSRFLVSFAPVRDIRRNQVLFLGSALLVGSGIALLFPWLYWGDATFGHISFAWLFAITLAVGIAFISAEIWVRGSKWSGAALAGGSVIAFWAAAFQCSHLRLGAHPYLNLMLYRYVNPNSGTSPLMPWLLLVAAALWWIWFWLSSRALWWSGDSRPMGGCGPQLPTSFEVLTETSPNDPAFDEGPDRRQILAALAEKRNEALQNLVRCRKIRGCGLLPPTVAVVLSLAVVFPHPVRSMEVRGYDFTYWAALTLTMFGLLWALVRFIMIWVYLRRLLVALDRVRLRRGFARMHGFTWRPLWGLGGSELQDSFVVAGRELELLEKMKMQFCVRTAIYERIETVAAEVKRLLQCTQKSDSETSGATAQVTNGVASIDTLYEGNRGGLASLLSSETTSFATTAAILRHLAKLQSKLASVAASGLLYLNAIWATERVDIEFEGKDFTGEDLRKEAMKLPPATRFTEDFLCLFYFNFISSVLRCMRALLMTVAGLFVFALLSFSSYPFEPRASFHTLMIFLFAVIAAAVGFVFAQMHRDATLSRITDTKPGELGLDFWLRLVAFVSVPMFSLLATAFPAIGGLLFSWLQPATQAFK